MRAGRIKDSSITPTNATSTKSSSLPRLIPTALPATFDTETSSLGQNATSIAPSSSISFASVPTPPKPHHPLTIGAKAGIDISVALSSLFLIGALSLFAFSCGRRSAQIPALGFEKAELPARDISARVPELRLGAGAGAGFRKVDGKELMRIAELNGLEVGGLVDTERGMRAEFGHGRMAAKR